MSCSAPPRFVSPRPLRSVVNSSCPPGLHAPFHPVGEQEICLAGAFTLPPVLSPSPLPLPPSFSSVPSVFSFSFLLSPLSSPFHLLLCPYSLAVPAAFTQGRQDPAPPSGRNRRQAKGHHAYSSRWPRESQRRSLPLVNTHPVCVAPGRAPGAAAPQKHILIFGTSRPCGQRQAHPQGWTWLPPSWTSSGH